MYIETSNYATVRPTEKDFTAEIISLHKDAEGKTIRQYSVDGIRTIGVAENEPFQINFTNKSREDVSVRITLDGIDTISGKPGDLNPDTLKWFVRAGATLHVKAWHESQSGGGRLVFTGEDKSVAAHVSNDLSHKSIIAFAVFMEQEAPKPSYYHYSSSNIFFNDNLPRRKSKIVEQGYSANSTSDSLGSNTLGATSYDDDYKSVDCEATVPCAAGATKIAEINDVRLDLDRERIGGEDEERSLRKSASVGAGEYTEQKTHTVKGLDKPTLNSVIRMRYMWWDELEAKLHNTKNVEKFASGFPGEKEKTFADLSSVPRVVSEAAPKKPEFTRTY